MKKTLEEVSKGGGKMSKPISKQQQTAVEKPTGREISKERRERRDRATTGLDLVSLWFWGHEEGARSAESTVGMIR
jgi:hypothetical protein